MNEKESLAQIVKGLQAIWKSAVPALEAIVSAGEPILRFFGPATSKKKYTTKASTTAKDVLKQVFPEEGDDKRLTNPEFLRTVKSSEAFLNLPPQTRPSDDTFWRVTGRRKT